jgi:TolB-like protein/Tfp pilus assembly protein PilF
VPIELERIVGKALAKNADERYQNASDLVVDLKAVRGQMSRAGESASAGAPSGRNRGKVRFGPVVAVTAMVAIAALAAWWFLGGDRGSEDVAGIAAVDERSSIAVLPLENLSQDEDHEYFADGMTEALIAELAQVRALRVISRTSVMRFKDTRQPITEVAAALGVNTIIEGSVLQAGERVRVTAQLIDARTDEHLWARSYERDAADVLKLQSEVARAIVDEVRVELTSGESERLASARSVDPEAYDLYLRGRYHWNRRTPADLESAMELFKQAIEIEPEYADAYAALAQTYIVLVNWSPWDSRDAYPTARELATKAIELDPNNAAAYAALGGVAQEWDWDWGKAAQYFRRSLELDPNNAGVHQWYAEHLCQQGKFKEAIAEIEVARRLDPFALIVRIAEGWIYNTAGDLDRAIEVLEGIIELEPQWPGGYLYIFLPYLLAGREADAVNAITRCMRLADVTWGSAADSVEAAYASGGIDAFWDSITWEAKRVGVAPGIVGFYHAAAGHVDSAMVWLNRAAELRAYPVHIVAVSQWCRSLRGDPRFEDLLERMNLAHIRPAYPID